MHLYNLYIFNAKDGEHFHKQDLVNDKGMELNAIEFNEEMRELDRHPEYFIEIEPERFGKKIAVYDD